MTDNQPADFKERIAMTPPRRLAWLRRRTTGLPMFEVFFLLLTLTGMTMAIVFPLVQWLRGLP